MIFQPFEIREIERQAPHPKTQPNTLQSRDDNYPAYLRKLAAERRGKNIFRPALYHEKVGKGTDQYRKPQIHDRNKYGLNKKLQERERMTKKEIQAKKQAQEINTKTQLPEDVSLATSAHPFYMDRDVPPEAPSNPISENIAKGFFSAIQFQLDDPSFDPLETNDNGQTVLHQLCEAGQSNLVDLVLKKGAEANKLDFQGRSPLHLACSKGHSSLVSKLMHLGVNSQKQDHLGYSPLMHACQSGVEATALMLVKTETDFSKSDRHGNTALHLAGMKGLFFVAEAIVKKCPEAKEYYNENFETPHAATLKQQNCGVKNLDKTLGILYVDHDGEFEDVST
eukprot:TRINITY_DN261_c0_g3_i1.p1 TRINITY_DN261_c0_g3~~TRINITY_DN261_c0_g3_i1.p1  ORF type:complete len:338 (-),score=53.63 TRINITY_DN261_c0_g3_i1:34-1047(-)